MRTDGIIVAIDGPAGAGKSTTAKAVATALGYLYLDTGAMYRAVALAAQDAGVDPNDEGAMAALCEGLAITQASRADGTRTFIDGQDVSEAIRTPEISDLASRVAVHPPVREVLVRTQKAIGAGGGIVLEGRDTTTAVFPDAELKVFLEASVDARAERRRRQLSESGTTVDVDTIRADIEARDDRDRATQARHGAWPPPDAIRVDTTGLTIDQQVKRIVSLAHTQGARAIT